MYLASETSRSPCHHALPPCLATLCREYFPYGFKGAQRAPNLGWVALLGKRRARMTLTRTRRGSRRSSGGLGGERCAPGRPPAALRHSVPRRRRRASRPRDPPHQLGTATISARRASCKGGPSRRFSVKPGKITCKGASRCPPSLTSLVPEAELSIIAPRDRWHCRYRWLRILSRVMIVIDGPVEPSATWAVTLTTAPRTGDTKQSWPYLPAMTNPRSPGSHQAPRP